MISRPPTSVVLVNSASDFIGRSPRHKWNPSPAAVRNQRVLSDAAERLAWREGRHRSRIFHAKQHSNACPDWCKTGGASGCRIFSLPFLDRGWGVEWILRLAAAGDEGPCVDIMEISKPDH